MDMCQCLFCEKVLTLTPHNWRGLWASAWGKVHTNLDASSPCARIDDIIAWHCLLEKVMAGNGYTSFHTNMLHKLNLPSVLLRLEIFIFLCHSFAIANKKACSVFMLPSGAMYSQCLAGLCDFEPLAGVLALVGVKNGKCSQFLVDSFVSLYVVLPLEID